MVVRPRVYPLLLVHLYGSAITRQHLKVHDDEHHQGQSEGKINDETDENKRGAAEMKEAENEGFWLFGLLTSYLFSLHQIHISICALKSSGTTHIL